MSGLIPIIVRRKNQTATIRIDSGITKYIRMCNRIYSWAQVVEQMNDVTYYMVTLTYKNITDWRPNHIRDFNLELRSMFEVIAYAWVAELQDRGAVHYHIIVVVPRMETFYSSNLKGGIGYPHDLGHWDHGISHCVQAKIPYYVTSYTAKKYQKFRNFPKGCRTFATYLSKRYFGKRFILEHRRSTIPKWLKDIINASPDLSGYKISRTSGGYYVGKIFIPTEYEVVNYKKRKSIGY